MLPGHAILAGPLIKRVLCKPSRVPARDHRPRVTTRLDEHRAILLGLRWGFGVNC